MKNRIIVAMDVPSRKDAISLAKKLDPSLCRLKVGMELFTAAGPAVVEDLRNLGFDIFLDLKYHDIPDTVAGAIRSAAGLGVWMANIHCLGGRKIMEAAANAVPREVRLLIIGVTILTSMKVTDLREVGIDDDESSDPTFPMVRLAQLAKQSGLDGVVCSGQEAAAIRKATDDSFTLVTPGIRLPDGNKNDQARIVTPEMAIQSGASHLVVGRPITGAADPVAALHEFNNRIASVAN
ncbi:MAG: orotidine-5-phosphate decarboxylase [Patescibacteria group bacterium]|nr:orotidine-5-phosphate decarboxylase [Patescibacteria group bacterium]MDQ5957093.1 orotidine-5-phosphate decarboxylase [Patescibacteria group bacterium]